MLMLMLQSAYLPKKQTSFYSAAPWLVHKGETAAATAGRGCSSGVLGVSPDEQGALGTPQTPQG